MLCLWLTSACTASGRRGYAISARRRLGENSIDCESGRDESRALSRERQSVCSRSLMRPKSSCCVRLVTVNYPAAQDSVGHPARPKLQIVWQW